MAQRLLWLLVALACAACGAPPAGLPPSDGAGPSIQRRLLGADELSASARQAQALLSSTAWLNDTSLTVTAVLDDAKDQGTERLTLAIQRAGAQGVARVVLTRNLLDQMILAGVDLAPEAAALPERPPSATGLPGGYQALPIDGADAREAARLAVRLLSEPAWLGRPVTASQVQEAASQVVDGTNVFLRLTLDIEGVRRPAYLVLYRPPSGTPSISWLHLGPGAFLRQQSS
jgi:hypothetical protein